MGACGILGPVSYMRVFDDLPGGLGTWCRVVNRLAVRLGKEEQPGTVCQACSQ